MRLVAAFMAFALLASPALAARGGDGMIEAIRIAIQDVCVSALAVIVLCAALTFVAEKGRRILSRFRSVTLAVWLCIAAASSVILGSDKTNGVLQAILPFGPQIQVVQLPQVPPVVPPSAPPLAAPSPRASADMPFRARAWNRRGAWNDSFRCAFPGEWVFPHGTGHLDRVEVCSQGRILPRYGSTNVIVSIGVPLQIVNPTTSFGCGPTDRNSYVFAWTNAVIGRVSREAVANAETIDASIELFRNGDIAITTNGVTELRPRELPFPRDGYGQDDEWVAANFTNATEILAVGYPQWVDAQVGEGLTNGLYKFTATVPDDPPETIQLVVGDYSVAVTNAGEYVFLLEKGVDYEYGTVPFMASATYSAVDDVPQTRGGTPSPDPEGQTPTWSVDGGRYGIAPQTESALGRVLWLPLFFGSPDVAHVGPGDGPLTFAANFLDCRTEPAATYSWSASPGITVQSPNAKTTAISFDTMPSWAVASVAVTATFGTNTLVSALGGMTYVTNDVPQIHLSLDVPDIVLVRTNVYVGGMSALLNISLVSDCETNGTVRIECERGAEKVMVKDVDNGEPVTLPCEWNTFGSSFRTFRVEGLAASESCGDVEFLASFLYSNGDTGMNARVSMTIADIWHLAVSELPRERNRNSLGVGESVMFYYTPRDVQILPSATAGGFLPTVDGMLPYYAPHTQDVSNVTLCLGGVTCSVPFTVFSPQGIVVDRVETNVYNVAGYAGIFEMTFHNRIMPTNVSFYAIETIEIPLVATNALGYYAQPEKADELDHGKRGGGIWGGIGYGNEYVDHAVAGYVAPPWNEGGSFTWPIPVAWRCRHDIGVTNVFCHTDQRFELDADGTVRVFKFGYCGERTTNNVFNLTRINP